MVRTSGLRGYSDVHFTDHALAAQIVEHFKPVGRCLEPFRGDGAFWSSLPPGSQWCEITEGRDFFAYRQPVDWIVTNPPFSNLTEVFRHAFSISENCVFLIPISKFFSSGPRLRLAREYGGCAEILHVGSGREIGFDIGFPFAAMHFCRGWSGPIHESYLHDARCGRIDGSGVCGVDQGPQRAGTALRGA